MPERWPPTLWDAVHRGDHGTVLRVARVHHGWTQAELGARFGCTASTISRFETGARALADVAMLRRFAVVLDLPAQAFGLVPECARPASPVSPVLASKVGRDPSDPRQREVDESVKRRAFLLAASITGAALATTTALSEGTAGDVDPAAFLTSRLESVLLGAPPASAVTPTPRLLSALTTATMDFRACRYVQLAVALPELIAAAQATSDATAHPDATTVLAHAYNLATRALIKLESSGLEWIAADRALHAARASEEPLVLAEAYRLMGSVCRRAGHHDRALDLTMQAADQLDVRGPQPSMAHLARYGVLLCSAGYARARANDRDRALDLLGEASATVVRLDQHPVQQAALRANVLSHQVSAEYVLGNAGIALHHADRATVDSFPDTERRGRFLVDVALCFSQLGKPRQAYDTLREAERAAPAEVRTRATVRELVTDLRNHRNQTAMPGLDELAVRTHVA